MLSRFLSLRNKIQDVEDDLVSSLAQSTENNRSLFRFKITLQNIRLVVLEILSDLLKYLIIIFADSGEGFQCFYNQRNLHACNISYSNFCQTQKKIRTFSVAGIASMVAVSVVTSLIVNLIFGGKLPTFASSFGWQQGDWNVSSAISAVHPGNMTNWQNYSQKDDNLTKGSNLTIASSSLIVSQGTDIDLKGASSNLRFYGTGTAAYLSLSRRLGPAAFIPPNTVDNGDGTWTTVLQPDATTGKDTMYQQYTDGGHFQTPAGTSTALHIRRYSGIDDAYYTDISMLQFDIASVPIKTVSLSSLSMYIYWTDWSGSRPIGIYAINNPWDESTAVWDNRPVANLATWTPESTVIVPQYSVSWFTWPATNMVSQWAVGSLANNGMAVALPGSSSGSWGEANAYSSDYSDPNYRPKLSITYVPNDTVLPYATSGVYYSNNLNIGQKIIDNSASLSWTATVTANATLGFQVASDNIGVPPDQNNTPQASSTIQYMGIGSGTSTDIGVAPEIQRLPDGKYRFYHGRNTSGSYTKLEYRDTLDTNWPNQFNLGTATPLNIGASSTDQASLAKIIAIGNGKYRFYYSIYDGQHWRMAYRDTLDSNLPMNVGGTSNNLDTLHIINSSLPSTETEYGTDIVQIGGQYRLYFSYVAPSPNNYHQIAYYETNDGQLPNENNLSSRKLIDPAASFSNRGYGPRLLRLDDGKYRLYYSYFNAKWQLGYRDTSDTNPPQENGTNLGPVNLLNTGDNAIEQAISIYVGQISAGVYRVYFGYAPTQANSYWQLAYKDVWTYYGPDGSQHADCSVVNYCYTNKNGSQIASLHNGASAFRYKALFKSTVDVETPLLDGVNIGYRTYGLKAPILHYSFDGSGVIASGTMMVDSSPNQYYTYITHTTGSGPSYFAQTGNMAALGSGVTLDGDDYFYSKVSAFNSAMPQLSMESWFNAVATGTFVALGTQDNAGAVYGGPSIGISGGKVSGRIQQMNNANGFGLMTSANSYNDGQWHHAVMTYDDSSKSAYLYVDGNVVGSLTATGTLNTQFNLVRMGIGAGGAFGGYTGSMDEVMVYDRALSAVEVANHYNGGRPMTITNTAQPSLLWSSWYNTTDEKNFLTQISWKESLAASTSIRIQLRTAADASGTPSTSAASSTGFIGLDGSAYGYFSASSTGCSKNSGTVTCTIAATSTLGDGASDQWMQYRIFLDTAGNSTPQADDFAIQYTVNTPPVINLLSSSAWQLKESEKDALNTTVTPGLDMTGRSTAYFNLADPDTFGLFEGNLSAKMPGKVVLSLQYCSKEGGICSVSADWSVAATSSFNIYNSLGALVYDGLAIDPTFTQSTTTLAVGDASNTPAIAYRVIFDAKKTGLTEKYLPNFHYRIVADDTEGANRYGYLDSGSFVLDTKVPVVTRNIDASTQVGSKPATVYSTVTDDTATSSSLLKMRMAADNSMWTDPAFGWAAYLPVATTTLLEDPETVYFQIKDEYGNVADVDLTSPDTPSNVIIADLSNSGADIYQLFLSWKKTNMPTGGQPGDFKRYVVWRATTTDDLVAQEDLVFERYVEIATSTQNFYLDAAGMSSTSVYHYKITTEDQNGDISRYMTGSSNIIIHDRPDGQGRTDVTPPTIQSVAVAATTTQSSTIIWDTDEPSDSVVIYIRESEAQANISSGRDPFESGLAVGVISMANYNGTAEMPLDKQQQALGRHQVFIGNLLPDTVYRFMVKSSDISTNFSTISQDVNSNSLLFQTRRGPVITNVNVSSVTNNTATIIWRTDLAADSVVAYSSTTAENNLNFIELQSPNVIKGAVDNVNDHEVKLFGLSPNTRYYFEVRSAETGNADNLAIGRDLSGGTEKYFDFVTTYDNTPPVIGLPSCQPAVVNTSGEHSLMISATTSEQGTAKLYYGTTSNALVLELATSTEQNTDQQFMVNGLMSSTTYYFKIVASDLSGNVGESSVFNCDTLKAMVAQQEMEMQLQGKVPEDEVGRRIASSSALMPTENDSDITDATSTLWVQLARQGWYSFSKVMSWLSASTTGMFSEPQITARIASTSLEMQASNNTTVSDATSSEWIKAAREKWVPESQKEKHEGKVYTQTDIDKAKSSGGIVVVDKTDKKAPVITDIRTENITATSARVTWATDEQASGFVKYGKTNSYGEYAGIADLHKDHYFDLKNLEPKTTYHFLLQSADSSGNLTTSDDQTFTTKELPLESVNTGLGIGSTTEPLTQETMKSAAQRMVDLLGQFSHVVSLSVFEGQVLSQYDALQKLANIVPAPVLSGEPLVESTPTTVTITWHTDKPANSIIAYSPEVLYAASKGVGAYVQQVGRSEESVNDHTVKIIGLKSDTLYHYQLRSKSKVGPEAVSRDFTFKTKPEALEIISYNSEILSMQKARFSWLTSQETNTELSVIPYRSGRLAVDESKTITERTMTTNHEIEVRDLESGIIYQVQMSGVSQKGIKISKTLSYFSTTKDDLPPRIDSIQTESALSQGKDVKVQTIITWNTNELTVGSVKFEKGITDDENSLTESTQLETNYGRKHTAIITNFDVGEVYTFRIVATDSGGNTSTSTAHTVLTPKQKEGVFELIVKTFESTFGWLGQMK